MKVFLSSTYTNLVDHRKTAHDENHPRMEREYSNGCLTIRLFVNYSWTVCPRKDSP